MQPLFMFSKQKAEKDFSSYFFSSVYRWFADEVGL
jgi:hypothetical protein